MNQRIIYSARSAVGLREALAASRVILKKFLGMGVEVWKFEQELSHYLNAHVACTANGTSAIQLGLQAMGIRDGDEVLVPSLTYVATFQAIAATGAVPVACDVDPSTLLIDLVDAESRITSKTKVIVPVHFGGQLLDRDILKSFSGRHNLGVLEDAAHSFGTVDSNGDVPSPLGVVAYSFDGIKNITSGEGGCIVSNDPNLVAKVSDLRLLGVIGDSEKRYARTRSWDFDVIDQGWRYHMSDVMAAIGRVQLKKFPVNKLKRRRIAKLYDRLLNGLPVQTLQNDYDHVVPHIYPILLPPQVDRDNLREHLGHLGISTGVHYQPNHLLTAFRSDYPLPATEAIYPRLLSLPMHPGVTAADQKRIVGELASALSSLVES